MLNRRSLADGFFATGDPDSGAPAERSNTFAPCSEGVGRAVSGVSAVTERRGGESDDHQPPRRVGGYPTTKVIACGKNTGPAWPSRRRPLNNPVYRVTLPSAAVQSPPTVGPAPDSVVFPQGRALLWIPAPTSGLNRKVSHRYEFHSAPSR